MANVFLPPQLTRLISSKPCPNLDPGPAFRPFRQLGFVSVWRDQAKNVCLMARSSVNIGGGRDSSGGHRYFGTHKRYSASEKNSGNSEIGEPEGQDSHSERENLETVKNQLLEKQLKEIQDQLRENSSEIKRLTETAQRAWRKNVRAEAIVRQTVKELTDNKTRLREPIKPQQGQKRTADAAGFNEGSVVNTRGGKMGKVVDTRGGNRRGVHDLSAAERPIRDYHMEDK